MRRIQMEQVKTLLELFQQAHDEIKTAVKREDNIIVLKLLEDCQNAAVSIGNIIENAEEKDSSVVCSIEEYCELAYQIYMSIVQKQFADQHKIYRTLNAAFSKMKNNIYSNIKVQREAVFLPYKASMWDSLESVWRAVAQDPDWNAYVIPIPYYDIKQDGTVGKMHYEIDLFPKDVPVLQYEKYHFEAYKPDMIFIHYPYDDCNYVTDIPPFFYTKNLKRFTKQLIYIPYFILNEVDPDNQEAVESLKHFCIIPGVLNSDKVIVQSESMREAYIRNLVGLTGKHTRRYWEDKILGLGSPKIDKVLNTKKENIEIPEEWTRVIQKPSGDWKKIILYNTSVNALVEHEEKMLDKMKRVFQTFKNCQAEIALLWRPHPLIQATIESMKPRLWTDYMEIVEQYKKERWGIYDDTAQLDRALVLSDGYYGDPSSLVQLCKKIGLPVMIQNVYV